VVNWGRSRSPVYHTENCSVFSVSANSTHCPAGPFSLDKIINSSVDWESQQPQDSLWLRPWDINFLSSGNEFVATHAIGLGIDILCKCVTLQIYNDSSS